MGLNVLIKKGIKKHKGTLFSIIILLFLIFTSLGVAITVYKNAGDYVHNEMSRMGFGNITAWVSNVNNLDDLKNEIKNIKDVEKVESQEIIFAGYSFNDMHSDDEGQLLKFDNNYPYKILNNNLNGYKDIEEIKSYEIYISPAMANNFNLKIGDFINFELSRDGDVEAFMVAGYFEDPFMGSSMIDMKSFLVNSETFDKLKERVSNTNVMQVLARNGAMLHIFQSKESNLSINEFNTKLNTNTNIINHTEFVYTSDTIYGFMMILENIFIGFLISFVIVLLVVSIIIIAHSITNSIDNDKKNFGILKTVGYNSITLRISQISQYGFSIIVGMVLSIIAMIISINSVSKILVTSAGFIIPTKIPVLTCASIFVIITLILFIVIILKTKKISYIKPIEIINESNVDSFDKKVSGAITKDNLLFDIAIRQVVSHKKRYIGIFVISILLTMFCLIVGKLDNWLGPNGEGLMNTFSVADHDIGIQPLNHIDMDNVQNIIREYSNIESVYALAMQSVTVNGTNYTANVIDNPSWFHILSGKTSEAEDEIVVTQMVADDLNIKIGDTVTITHERQYREYKVVGIYQCANEMGANIGMSRSGYERIGNVNAYIWCYHFILDDHTHNDDIMKELQNTYPMQVDVHTNSWSGLDGIVSTMNSLIIFMYIIVIIFILIVVNLVSSKLLNIERHDMGIYKSLGFTSKELRKSIAIRFLVITFVGGMIGLLLSSIFADKIILSMLKMFGIGEFIGGLSFVDTIIPVIILTITFGICAYLTSKKIKKVSLIDLVND